MLGASLQPGMAGIVGWFETLQSTFWSRWGQTLVSPSCLGASPDTSKSGCKSMCLNQLSVCLREKTPASLTLLIFSFRKFLYFCWAQSLVFTSVFSVSVCVCVWVAEECEARLVSPSRKDLIDRAIKYSPHAKLSMGQIYSRNNELGRWKISFCYGSVTRH